MAKYDLEEHYLVKMQLSKRDQLYLLEQRHSNSGDLLLLQKFSDNSQNLRRMATHVAFIRRLQLERPHETHMSINEKDGNFFLLSQLNRRVVRKLSRQLECRQPDPRAVLHTILRAAVEGPSLEAKRHYQESPPNSPALPLKRSRSNCFVGESPKKSAASRGFRLLQTSTGWLANAFVAFWNG